jgi:hypothetical protein
MPVYLEQADVDDQVADSESVLVVPCRFCPAASMAVRSRTPYIQLFRRFLKTAAYERFIARMTRRFESRGIRTSVFKSRWPHQFVLCMWTARRRRMLRERAKKHDAVVVLGCEAAGRTVRDSLGATGCRVIQGMRSEGIMSLRPGFGLPCNLSLELESVTSAH